MTSGEEWQGGGGYLRAVAGGGGAALLERGLELREALHRGTRARTLVLRHSHGLFVAILILHRHGHRDDLILEETVLLGVDGLLVGEHSELVLLGAGEAVLGSDVLGGDAHGGQAVRRRGGLGQLEQENVNSIVSQYFVTMCLKVLRRANEDECQALSELCTLVLRLPMPSVML